MSKIKKMSSDHFKIEKKDQTKVCSRENRIKI